MAVLTPAGQAEVLRAARKDEAYIQHLEELLADVACKLCGTRLWVKLRDASHLAAQLSYYAATTLSALQTVGEEYTGIVQVDASHSRLLPWRVTLAMVLLDCAGVHIALCLLGCLERRLQTAASMRPRPRLALLSAARLLRAWLPVLRTLHRALFYLTGSFYSVAKRLTSVHYGLVCGWRKDRRTRLTFRLLGLATLACGCGAAARELAPGPGDDTPVVVAGTRGEGPGCALCLDQVHAPSCTPCGHVFCWGCLLQWLQSSSDCPLCREKLQPSQVVPLVNL